VVVTDEVYEHLTFDDHEHVPLATLPGMFERTVTISSSGKTFSFTGWKIGWATGPADLVAAVEGAKNWLSYSSGAPFQPAIAQALDHEAAFHEQLREDLRKKRDFLCEALDSLSYDGLGLEVHVPQGTYFVTTDASSLGHADGKAFCAAMAERAKVVAIPNQVFYEDGSDEGRHLIRWAFCKEQDVLEEGIRRLRSAALRA
jgi:N-succinyldiaminopimelate aminotransferase